MNFKSFMFALIASVLTIPAFSQDLLLTAIVDADLSGGTPKAVELYVINDITDLSLYGLGTANNGGGSDGQEFTFPAVAATAGDFIYCTANDGQFDEFFGFSEDYVSGILGINGDDAVELYFNGNIIDIYGVADVNGDGEPWDYTDSWAYRAGGTFASTAWVGGDWIVPGLGTLDGETTNASSSNPVPFGTYDPTSTEVPGCTDDTACNYDAAATLDNGSCLTVGDSCDDANAGTVNDVYQSDCSCAGVLDVLGCTDSGACNFNAAATTDDGSCDFSCVGCTDPAACNYDVAFTIEDGSCGFEGDTCDDGDAGTTGDEYQPDCSCAGTAVVLTNSLMITAAFDGPLTDGAPKGVELYALADIDDLSNFGLGSANNGGGTDGEEFVLPAVPLSAGSYIFVTSDDTGAQVFFESTANNYNAGSAISINGDDAVELFEFGIVIDVFGDINMDGTGTAWDHLDSWAHRNCEQTPNGGVFDAANWTFGGTNVFDGTMLNAEAANPMPVGAYEATCPSVVFGCTNPEACNFNMNATDDDGSCELIGDSCDDGNPLTENDVLQADCSCAGTAVATCDPVAWSIATVATNSDMDMWIDNGDGSYSANGFCGGGCQEVVDLWLVSNGFDYSSVTTSSLVFSLSENFGSTVLDLQYTTSYSGDPAASTWTSLGTYDAAGGYTADLSVLAGSPEVYFAFQYADDGADGYSNFVLSDLALTGDCPADVTVFDCPVEMANIGDSCDDMDATTFDDVLLEDCSCAGTPYDCPVELANIGDSCDDGDAMTNGDMILADCSCAGTPFVLTNGLVITAVYDGPLSGGTPKGVELYVVADIADLSIFGIGSANNGGGTDGEEFTFPVVSVSAGDFIYVTTNDLTEFNDFFGFEADYGIGGVMGINGDDAIELFEQGTVIDTFGDINTDGTGATWEYLDGWAYRNCETGPDGSVFVEANWTFSGINALDGETTNATAVTPIPVGTYSTECEADVLGCTDENASNYNELATLDDGSCEFLGCTDPLFLEYNPYAQTEDGTCMTLVVEGCIYDTATNYDPNANVDNDTCVFDLNSCPGDFNGDDAITVGDLSGFLAAFGTLCD